MRRLAFLIIVISALLGLRSTAHALSVDSLALARGVGEDVQSTLLEVYLTDAPKEVGDVGFHLIASTLTGTQRFAFGGGPFLKPFKNFSIIPVALVRLDTGEDSAYAGTALGAKMFWVPSDTVTVFLGTNWNIMSGKLPNYLFANPRLSWWLVNITSTAAFGVIADGHVNVNSRGNSTIGFGPGVAVGSTKSPLGVRLAGLYDAGNQSKDKDRLSALLTVYLGYSLDQIVDKVLK